MIQEMDELDLEIKQLEQLIDQAAASLLTFYDQQGKGFRRSTLQQSGTHSATTTARALFALAEYVRFLQERGADEDGEQLKRASEVLIQSTTTWILELADPTRLTTIRKSSDNEENNFTDSHLLMAVTLVPRLHVVLGSQLNHDAAALRQAGGLLRDSLVQHLKKFTGGKIHADDPTTHDFITLHALRAIDAFTAIGWGRPMPRGALDKLRERVECDVLAKLGYHSASVEAEFDPAELLFTTALLERCKTPSWQKLLQRAVEVVVEDQTSDGAWLGSRVVAYEKQGLLHVASYEVGLTLSYLAASAVRRDDRKLLELILPSLRLVCGLAQASFHTYGGVEGWANDRTRWPNLLEGWATAIVLTLLMRYRETLLDVRQHRVLRRYGGQTAPAGGAMEWTDLRRTLRAIKDADEKDLSDVSDPSPNGELVRSLCSEILTPIMKDPAERPKKAGLILYGTPGTRKTTMVKELARTLGWPMVTLSPPDFLGPGGLEGFEAAAARVFTDLGRLRRVVILFDECEDFFRPRPTAPKRLESDTGPPGETGTTGETSSAGPSAGGHPRPGPSRDTSSAPGTRTIGAFITAGMLPRLQDLRDKRWNVFVLATNVDIEDLDEAAVRPGRFDFAQRIDDPGVLAQVRYASKHREHLTEKKQKALIKAIETVDRVMPFRAIDEAAKRLAHGKLTANVTSIEAVLREEGKRDRPPALYPTGPT